MFHHLPNDFWIARTLNRLIYHIVFNGLYKHIPLWCSVLYHTDIVYAMGKSNHIIILDDLHFGILFRILFRICQYDDLDLYPTETQMKELLRVYNQFACTTKSIVFNDFFFPLLFFIHLHLMEAKVYNILNFRMILGNHSLKLINDAQIHWIIYKSNIFLFVDLQSQLCTAIFFFIESGSTTL